MTYVGALLLPYTYPIGGSTLGAPKWSKRVIFDAPRRPIIAGHIFAKMCLFGRATSRVLVLVYAREFQAPNIYLLLPPTGGQMDISGGFVTPLHLPRHTVDILDPQILKNDEKCVILCLTGLSPPLAAFLFYHNFLPPRSKAVGRTRACQG